MNIAIELFNFQLYKNKEYSCFWLDVCNIGIGIKARSLFYFEIEDLNHIKIQVLFLPLKYFIFKKKCTWLSIKNPTYCSGVYCSEPTILGYIGKDRCKTCSLFITDKELKNKLNLKHNDVI